jgi:hypothetical protein
VDVDWWKLAVLLRVRVEADWPHWADWAASV